MSQLNEFEQFELTNLSLFITGLKGILRKFAKPVEGRELPYKLANALGKADDFLVKIQVGTFLKSDPVKGLLPTLETVRLSNYALQVWNDEEFEKKYFKESNGNGLKQKIDNYRKVVADIKNQQLMTGEELKGFEKNLEELMEFLERIDIVLMQKAAEFSPETLDY